MTIGVFWVQCGPRGSNFGDWASESIVRLVSGQETIHWDVDNVNFAQIVAAGSVLHLVPPEFQGYVWGTGCIQDDHVFRFPDAKIQAVRGKLTAKRLGVDVPLGDPLLLWQGVKRPKYKVGIVPHYVDFQESAIYEYARANESVLVIDMLARDAADRIASCECILSSALHGLVLADAMGIPNRWTLFSDNKIVGHGFKLRDYYSAFDINDPIPYRFNANDKVETRIYDTWEPRPLQKVQSGLLESFPKELLSSDTPLWEERSRVIAKLIPMGASVIDFGAGTQVLRKYVGEYQPCDVLKTSPETLVCDFNLNQYPATDKKYDYAVISGVMEYVATPFYFLNKVATFASRIVLTYAQRTPNQSIQSRRLSGWVNHLTKEELEGMFVKMGVRWKLEATWHEQLIYTLEKP